MRTVARVRRDRKPLFAHLTYPGEFSRDPARWKRDLRCLSARIHRKFPHSSLVWRLEFQARQAPHYHLFVWGVPFSREVQLWLSRCWYEVVGSGDERHLRAGTTLQVVRSWRGAMSYASKYLCKSEQAAHEGVGRWWGVCSREQVPWGELVIYQLTAREAARVVRLFRRFAGLRSRAYKSLTVFLDGSFWDDSIGRALYPS